MVPAGDGSGHGPAAARPQGAEPVQAPQHASAPAPPPAVDLARIGPLRAAVWEVLAEEGGGWEEGTLSALLVVTPLRGTPANTAGLSSVPGYPMRCAALQHTFLRFHSVTCQQGEVV